MKLIPIVKPFNKGTSWINPEYIISVFKTNIGHKHQGIIGTAIVVFNLDRNIVTNESIESVIERIQDESN